MPKETDRNATEKAPITPPPMESQMDESQTDSPIENPIDNAINAIEKDKKKYIFESSDIKSQDFMDPSICMQVFNKYSNLYSIPIELTYSGITKLIQDGGTNQSKPNLIITVGDKEFELNKLREIIKTFDKTYTVRKFSKGARDLIIKISLLNEWQGPLSKELSRINTNLTITSSLAPWCNEIHSDNYDCPNEIRDALVRREEQLKLFFKTKPKGNPNQKPRKGRGKRQK